MGSKGKCASPCLRCVENYVIGVLPNHFTAFFFLHFASIFCSFHSHIDVEILVQIVFFNPRYKPYIGAKLYFCSHFNFLTVMSKVALKIFPCIFTFIYSFKIQCRVVQ